MIRQKVAGIVNLVGKGFINIDDAKANPVTAVSSDARYLTLRLTVLLKYGYSLHVKTQGPHLQV